MDITEIHLVEKTLRPIGGTVVIYTVGLEHLKKSYKLGLKMKWAGHMALTGISPRLDGELRNTLAVAWHPRRLDQEVLATFKYADTSNLEIAM